MCFHSILFQHPNDLPQGENCEEPDFFHDLNLDQVIEAITSDWKDYELVPFYYTRLSDLDAIRYRQEVVQDLEDKTLMQALKSFSGKMHAMRERLSEVKKLRDYKHSMERRFMVAAEIYCNAVESLSQSLRAVDVRSRGLYALREYLREYLASVQFHDLQTDLRKLKADLSAISYCLLIKDGSVTVRPYNSESDYSVAVERAFEKFRGSDNRYWIEARPWEGMNRIEAKVLNRLALLYPETFRALDAFYVGHGNFLEQKISRFEREIQFYISYLTYIERFRVAGLNFCRAQLSQTSKEIQGRNAFDIALAGKLIKARAAVVPNDFFLSGLERIFVVSGPNQGGKTTFARMIGQLHYLASLGLPVPGTEARLYHFDRLFAHFEQEEHITNLRGKLMDDLVRIRHILDQSTPNSLVVINEIFSSTTLKDAIYLSKEVMARISDLDLLGVWVTFLDELSSYNEKTVSVVSKVDPDNPSVRTYKLERRPADGLAYALAIAQKHRVTYDSLKERIKP